MASGSQKKRKLSDSEGADEVANRQSPTPGLEDEAGDDPAIKRARTSKIKASSISGKAISGKASRNEHGSGKKPMTVLASDKKTDSDIDDDQMTDSSNIAAEASGTLVTKASTTETGQPSKRPRPAATGEIQTSGNVSSSAAETSSASSTPVIPDFLQQKNLQDWGTNDVFTFLNVNKNRQFGDEHIKVIQGQEVAGIGLLELTKTDLIDKPYHLKGGPAAGIDRLVKDLKVAMELVSGSALHVRLNATPASVKVPSVTPDRRPYPDETDEGRDQLMVIPTERLEYIEKFIRKRPVTLLRSPLLSGKSTLGVTLRDRFLAGNYDAVYISLAGLPRTNAPIEEGTFDNFWKYKAKRTWTQCLRCIKPTIVIVDEAQALYGNKAMYFWGDLKSLHSADGRNDKLRVFLLATYDPVWNDNLTPLQFTNSLGLKDLLLSESDFEIVVEWFVNLRDSWDSTNFSIPQEVVKTIFNFTGGHAGLCRHTIFKMRQKFRDGGTTEDMLKYLVSRNFLRSTEATRAYEWASNWSPTNEEAESLRNLLLQDYSEPIDLSSSVARNFIMSGLLVVDSDYNYHFAAPIMRTFLTKSLFKARVDLRKSPSTTFDEFLLRTIERMRPSVLRTSLGLGSGPDLRLLERTWQMEWYRTALTVVPVGASVSPDVGSVFGSDGFLDFYVDGKGYSWGVELLREGDRMHGHARRFEPGGEYNKIPLTDYVIIDFRHKNKTVQTPLPHFWHALYADDYEHITIRRSGEKDKVLILGSDTEL